MDPEAKYVEHLHVTIQNSINRYTKRLEQMKKDGAKPTEIAYVEKCIANFQEASRMVRRHGRTYE
jgi:hypothetical protein